MSNKHLNLDHIPALEHPGYPNCGTCEVETYLEDCDWLCPSCGTAWNVNSLEYDEGEGTAYEDWSGVVRTGPVASRDEAWRYSEISDPDERDRQIIAGNEEPRA